MARTRDPRAREALLTAARVELCRLGIDRARVEDITKRAGLSKGAFYLHFESKEAAFDLLVQRTLGAMDELLGQVDESEKELIAQMGYLTARDIARRSARFRAWRALRRHFDVALLDLFWRNRDILAVIESNSSASTLWGGAVAAFRARVTRQLLREFSGAQQSGGLRQGLLPEAVTDLTLGAFEAFLRRMTEMVTKPDLAAWADTVNEVLNHGILPAAGAARPRGRRTGRE